MGRRSHKPNVAVGDSGPGRYVANTIVGEEVIKPIVVVLVLTVFGGIIGMFVVLGIWEAANRGHAPENAAGGLWGFMLGAPVGVIVGLISGAIWAIVRFRYSNKA